MRRKIVAGNWKMNGSKDLAKKLVGHVQSEVGSLDNGVEVVIIPPAIYVNDVAKQSGGDLAVGIQNVGQWQSGAYTGEISADMAKDQGCRYALVGHSERRQLFGESDEVVAAKVERLTSCGLTAVVCVGETLDEREAGQAEAVVARQVKEGLANVAADQWDRIVVAYEPVWAIGTGKTATAEDAQAMHASIRGVLSEIGAPAESISLLYGGSVKADNAAALFAEPDIDGGLIGGASLVAEDFVSICRSVPAGTKS
ncbi:triose-phosphate isomerase [Marinobacter sp. M216]|uniref:Triosephosphate isomerase n=1 Tax=Marinobacter albus TaxID=3030833 RepID=A0ABT7H9E8_9GAMM|nr:MULTISPECIES: triose-phosphate isomerase [unclassified Marinobacter]MBW7471127.1 triose-phosphate isomerase [Marinobacter sp. F4218]MDK9556582.1 triose-phosphate isomerase [Marinobacter sp. M216]